MLSRNRVAILHGVSFLSAILIFSLGIGRYRVVLAYAFYSFIACLLTLKRPDNKDFYWLLLPLMVISISLDIARGAVMPLFEHNYLVVAIGTVFVGDTVAKNCAERLIGKLSKGLLFVICPSCFYENKELVEKCIYCSYEKGSSTMLSPPVAQPPYGKIAPRVLNILKLQDEQILFYLSWFPSKTVFINSERDSRAIFVITTRNIILLDYYRFALTHPESWRVKDKVDLSAISSVEITTRDLYHMRYPLLVISTTSGDKYEMIFHIGRKYSDRMKKIVDILREMNPKIEISDRSTGSEK